MVTKPPSEHHIGASIPCALQASIMRLAPLPQSPFQKKLSKQYLSLIHIYFSEIITTFADIVNLLLSTKNRIGMESERINRIKVVLVEQNRTGKWLAEQLQKNEATISRWCSNTSQPSLEMLVKIATVLNVEPKDLINTLKDA